MNSRVFGMIAFVAGMLLPAAALAQSVIVSTTSNDNSAVIGQLERQQQLDEYKAKFWSQEPITQQDYYVQERQDPALIARISAGQPVSAAELRQALGHVDTEY